MCGGGGGLDVKSVQMGEKKSQETLLSPGTQLTTSTWTGRHHLQHEHSGRLQMKHPLIVHVSSQQQQKWNPFFLMVVA